MLAGQVRSGAVSSTNSTSITQVELLPELSVTVMITTIFCTPTIILSAGGDCVNSIESKSVQLSGYVTQPDTSGINASQFTSNVIIESSGQSNAGASLSSTVTVKLQVISFPDSSITV